MIGSQLTAAAIIALAIGALASSLWVVIIGGRQVRSLRRNRDQTLLHFDELRKKTQRRDDVEAVLRTLLVEVPMTFVALDQDGYITMSIGRRSRTGKAGDHGVIGQHISEVMPEQPWMDIVNRAMAGRTVHRLVEHSFGRIYEVSAAPILVREQVTGVTAVLTEVSERVALEEELRVQAETDSLTGLINRSMFQRELNDLFRYQSESTYLLMMDVDGFKHVNDTYGHQRGDEVLRTLSHRLGEIAGLGDVVARLGGDEFGVLVQAADRAAAIDLAKRLGAQVAQPIEFASGVAHLTASIGVVGPTDAAGVHTDADTTTVLANADLAMYQAKRDGGNQVVVFTPDMREDYVAREQLKTELVAALERDELIVYYQPIWNAVTGQIHSIEALVRWEHPQQGLLEPARFLDLASEGGLLGQIDFAVLRKACAQLAEWDTSIGSAAMAQVRLNSNFSPHDFARPACLALAEEIGERYRFAPGRLVVEVTETALLANIDRADEAVEVLRAQGIDIALDDFGTGYSSLAQLHQLRPDVLKIDKTFVQMPLATAESTVAMIVAFAKTLDMSIVAEGVESLEQLDMVRRAGCDAVQGNLFGRAMPPEEIEPLLLAGAQSGHPDITGAAIALDDPQPVGNTTIAHN